jgi:hypothetical protein
VHAGLLTLLGPSFRLPSKLKSHPRGVLYQAWEPRLPPGLWRRMDLVEHGRLFVYLYVVWF